MEIPAAAGARVPETKAGMPLKILDATEPPARSRLPAMQEVPTAQNCLTFIPIARCLCQNFDFNFVLCCSRVPSLLSS
jgi:hypothetical protein